MTATVVSVISTRQQVLRVAEFSLVEVCSLEGISIAGRLRFPPLCARIAIRENIALLKEYGAVILSQQCKGDEVATTDWSALIFQAELQIYRKLREICKHSNLSVVRAATTALFEQLETAALTIQNSGVKIQRLETQTGEQLQQLTTAVVDVVTAGVVTDEAAQLETTSCEATAVSAMEAESATTKKEVSAGEDAPVASTQEPLATWEQLQGLPLKLLKELAAVHNIKGCKTKAQYAAALVGLVTSACL